MLAPLGDTTFIRHDRLRPVRPGDPVDRPQERRGAVRGIRALLGLL